VECRIPYLLSADGEAGEGMQVERTGQVFSEYVVVSLLEHRHLLISDLESRMSENDISSSKANLQRFACPMKDI
jgi:hypothetical protein